MCNGSWARGRNVRIEKLTLWGILRRKQKAIAEGIATAEANRRNELLQSEHDTRQYTIRCASWFLSLVWLIGWLWLNKMASTVEDLNRLYPNWSDDEFTWTAFGGCTQEILNDLMKDWFPTNAKSRAKLQDIWNRHSLRQQGMYSSFRFLVSVIIYLIDLPTARLTFSLLDLNSYFTLCFRFIYLFILYWLIFCDA